MSYEDAENDRIGQLVRQAHYEHTGQRLQSLEVPCLEAVQAGIEAIREAERAVIDLDNDTAHP